MHRTTQTWDQFNQHWQGPLNFRLDPSLLTLAFDFPSLAQMVQELRLDDDASMGAGTKGRSLNTTRMPRETFRVIPIDTLMQSPFSLAHFSLARFDAPGKCLHGFGKNVLQPMQSNLAAAGFTWERCYPIIFISGIGSATNYHMDFSHVLAWQIYGQKRFCGLTDPNQWANKNTRLNYNNQQQPKPLDIRQEDSLCYDMRPNDTLWNVLLTPHWVQAGDEPAMSLNFSFGGLRHQGKLSPNEQELEIYRQEQPDKAPKKITNTY